MTQHTKPETLLEMVERLDTLYDGETSFRRAFAEESWKEWPRLRDEVRRLDRENREMREELERVKMVVGDVDYDIIVALLARLDAPHAEAKESPDDQFRRHGLKPENWP